MMSAVLPITVYTMLDPLLAPFVDLSGQHMNAITQYCAYLLSTPAQWPTIYNETVWISAYRAMESRIAGIYAGTRAMPLIDVLLGAAYKLCNILMSAPRFGLMVPSLRFSEAERFRAEVRDYYHEWLHLEANA